MILIPVKDLRHAKQRLADVLSQERRTALAITMLDDVLAAVSGWQARPPVALVTGYAPAKDLAAKYGFDVIEDNDNAGESEAIAMATRAALARGATETMVVPGDMPLITSDELIAVYAAAPSRGLVLVPSADGRGSNAVLRRPGDIIPLRFGNDSFILHFRAAEATGQPVIVLRLPGIGLDIDTPADLQAVLAVPVRSRTQALLTSWNVPGSLSAIQRA